MEILTNDNNEYFGLVTDYKNLEVFRRAVMEESMYSDRVVIKKMIEMRPLTDHELSEEGDYSTYEPGHWIPVNVPCETSQAFYFATQGVENEKPSVVTIELDDKELDNEFDFEDNTAVRAGTDSPLIKEVAKVSIENINLGDNTTKEDIERLGEGLSNFVKEGGIQLSVEKSAELIKEELRENYPHLTETELEIATKNALLLKKVE